MDLKTKIHSLQATAGISFKRPDQAKLEEMHNKLRGSPGYEYLVKVRGLTDETIDHFRLGYDAVKDAIAIPHFKNGELINIKYRFLNPKDIRYTSEPNAEQWLFHDEGIAEALSKGAVAIAEGEMDCISLWQMGFKNVISPGSGANSYGTWVEQLDKVKQIWIAYDNDGPGQSAARELASRLGVEKCKNVVYPEGIKDANEYMLAHSTEQLRELFSKAPPFYKYEFSGLGEIIQRIIEDPMDYLEVELLPGVQLERDQLVVLSGITNGNKSTVSLNIIRELAERGIPSLFMPFERGVYSLGKRYLQIAMNKTREELQFTSKEEWQNLAMKLAQQPVYMAVPDRLKIADTIRRAKKIFGVKMVIIDHLDYVIRNLSGNREQAISDTMQSLKRLAEEIGVIIVVVTHVRKLDDPGSLHKRKPNLDDLKGSSSLKQDPEVVAIVHPTEDGRGVEVDIQKNKGPMGHKFFAINTGTGLIKGAYDADDY
jgi:twinkle protein